MPSVEGGSIIFFNIDKPTSQEEGITTLLLGIYFSEKAMAPHSSSLAWKIPWTEEPGGLQSMGSPRVGHD